MRISIKLFGSFFTGIIVWLGLAGCTFNAIPQATPTLVPITLTATSTPLPSPSQTPAITLTMPPTITEIVVQPTATPLPPSQTPTATSTPGPYLHTLEANETLGYIIQLYGHRSFDVIEEVIRINDNIVNADILPPVGSVIQIPRPTQASAPNGTDDGNTAPIRPTSAVVVGSNTVHLVQDGESLIDVAQQYSTTLEIISQLNPSIGFFGCNFNIPSGGPDCNPFISIGQEIIVPAPTPTPTSSPTPSGNETATPTPTYMPPIIVFPPNNGVAQSGTFRLQWVSVGVLLPNEVYLVYIKNVTTDAPVSAFTTRETTFLLPQELIPPPGERHEFQWWVTVASPNAAGQFSDVGSASSINTFFWGNAP